MATTLKESFRQFASNVNITDRQTTIVSNCRNNIVSKIGAKLSLHSEQPSKLIGSYDRDTSTRYLSEGDVDVMVVLHYGDNEDWDNKDGVSKSLNRFKSILQEAYPKTTCKIDRNCVTMKLSEFRLDVIPTFRWNTGEYTIPDTHRGQWLKTNPVRFAEEVTRINKRMDGTFIPLIKMVKAWNREYTNKLRGFHIECMMMAHYKNYDKSYTYDSTLNVFFSNLPNYLNTASYDPITGDRVDLYLDNSSLGNDRQTFVKRAQNTAKKSKEAYEDGEKYPIVAVDEWKDILGEFFPAYG
ncbi:MAG: hypothetical protein AMXMBFR44_4480 [Candidatus Campbellbacteria bacterium]